MGPKRLAVITGANKGIGLEIAKKLAESGVHTILACRNIEHEGIALDHFKHLGLDAEFRILDISDRHSINHFAHGVERDFGKIDILVNNAAIAFKNSDPTPFEQQARPTVHTNYFGTLWTTQALLPLLRKSSNPRIVNVASSAGHLRILKSKELRDQFTSPDLTIDKLSAMMEEFVEAVESGRHAAEGWPNTCYGTSKLAVIALTQVLARENPGILVNACCPGYCATDMSSHQGTRSAEMGARTPVYLALLPENVGLTGKFLSDEQDITASW
eukprot:gene33789-40887_t